MMNLEQWREKLNKEVEEYNSKLQELVVKQEKIKNPEKLAVSILEYENLENEISDRGQVVSILDGMDRFTSDYFKAEIISYFEAAETVEEGLVDFLADSFHQQVTAKELEDFDHEDIWLAHYKEYVLPGKILAHKFEQLDDLVGQMNERIIKQWPEYDKERSKGVLKYAFEKVIDGNIKLDPLIDDLKEREYKNLSEEDKNELLESLTAALGVKRFEEARQQEVAMDKAINMLKS